MELRSTYNQQLKDLDAQMLVMGSAMEEAVVTALRVIETHDAQEAQRVIDGDNDIDQLERDIESDCLRMFLMQQPVASDLRRISSALKMVGDMERIGDQAADICEIVTTLEGALPKEIADHIDGMGKRVVDMVHGAVQAFVERDVEKARMVMAADERVNDLFSLVMADIIGQMRTAEVPSQNLVDALMIAKYLERTGDHAQNIAEWVEYSLTGYYKGEAIG